LNWTCISATVFTWNYYSWYICSWRCTSWFYQKDRCRSGRRLDSYSANTWIFI